MAEIDFPTDLLDGPTNPSTVAELLVFIARKTGNYLTASRLAADEIDRVCENNAEKICALAYLIGLISADEKPGMRYLLRLAVPLIARELADEAKAEGQQL
jgi:hypothetical protein